MRLNLLSDYRGVLTNEVYYPAGVYEMPAGIGAALVAAGRAVALPEPEPEPKPEPKPKTTATKRGRKQ
jgi:hypothetical protein